MNSLKRKTKQPNALDRIPRDPWDEFAWFVSRCATGFGSRLMGAGKTATQARNAIIGCFLDFASGEACRLAREEGREPDIEKWRKATTDAFERAVKRTSPTPARGGDE